ncbi:MAG TPA: SAM-dependent methyltransferase [Casimicrobiaceae bacterium]|nr:SAM-dependent methyltransferase [Casimicrobiaceae bacterium]
MLAHLKRTIAEEDGWISFADYMSAVLYAPGLGYYASGTHKLGPGGDFVTAPELTPLFGRAVAVQIEQALGRLERREVIELGPGSGRLCADILAALAERDALPARYWLLEVSPDLRERQRAHLEKAVPEQLPRVGWIDMLPDRWEGAILANEVLDAVPVHLIVRGADEWLERGVVIDSDGRLGFADRALVSPALRERALARVPPVRDYLSELNPGGEALLSSLAQRCERGLMLILDYGFPAAEYYHPQRDRGTLMTHYRQHVLADPFFRPGLADLTAHVDFSAMARAGAGAGMTVAGFTTQARFLINCGILDALARCGDPGSSAYLRAASVVQKLTSPAEMGELVKVLALTRGIAPELAGFRDGDRAHRL